MKVIEAIKRDQLTLSFEFFPPKTPDGEEKLMQVISELKQFAPDFVSVTYGALGTTRAKTFWWAERIKREQGIEPLAHLTCVAADQKGIVEQLSELKKLGIKNILALRGDPPVGDEKFVAPTNGFRHASDLVALIKRQALDLCVGVAGYPEGHVESPSLKVDIDHLKAKLDAGAEFVITQLFFDNNFFFEFLEQCGKAGIKVPIVPGIMPIVSVKQLKKMTGMVGATIPVKLLAKLEKHESDPASIAEIGVEQAVGQCQELLKAKVPGLHFFVLNQSGPISEVLNGLNMFKGRKNR